MTINLPNDVERSIQEMVDSGRFASIGDAISAAWKTFLLERSTEPHPYEEVSEETVFDTMSRAGLIGCIEGATDSPTDLSTNPVHMEGFGIE